MLTHATDVVCQLNWDIPKSPKGIQKQLFITLETEEQMVYDFLKTKGKEHLDYIALQCELPVYKLSSLFLNMELKGVVRPLPGKYFEII